MYESPISLSYNRIIQEIDDNIEQGILEAIWKVDINVNRDELLKALRYDRQQYSSGYKDGIASEKRCEFLRLNAVCKFRHIACDLDRQPFLSCGHDDNTGLKYPECREENCPLFR